MKLKWQSVAFTVTAALMCSVTSADAWVFKRYDQYPQRNAAVSQNGMVTATSPLATAAGIEIMKKGGNAFDAAVATALMLNATDPSMCGPMGAAFFTLFPAKEGKVVALDAGTMTPLGMTPDLYKTDGKEDRSKMLEGPLSWTIGGALAGYIAVLEKYGTMTFAQVSEPAIYYLENGFPMSQHDAEAWKNGFPDVPLLFPNLARVFAKDATWQEAGTVIKNPELAQTYRTVAKEGIDAFYKGSIAKEMVRYVQEQGGYWTMDDLAAYKVQWKEPLKMTFKDLDVYGVPPPASSMTWMQMLKMAEKVDWSKFQLHSAEYVNMMTEIERLAHADSYGWGGDPMFSKSTGDLTLTDKYIASQLERIVPGKAAPGKVQPGDPYKVNGVTTGEYTPPAPLPYKEVKLALRERFPEYPGQTTHINVIDKDGNAVSFTHTLGTYFGGHDLLGNTGVIANNAANWDDLEISHWTEAPSNLAMKPGARNRWTLCPGMMLKDGKVFMLVGGSGADSTQPAVFQAIMNRLQWNMNPQDAVSAPRHLYGDMRHYTAGTKLQVEPEIRDTNDVAQKLVDMGYDLVPASQTYRVGTPGYALMIWVDPETNTRFGGAETRINGHVSVY
ncbi:MAG: gamma-glutamyltransferase family protein [Methylobacteriaceae bacterium]|jgi:gamma-glutamyltranspeptidase/glutathione hydrolase|nr:gamma-glutamyltransferase family protein [Methylobacteriaceae bacterium]